MRPTALLAEIYISEGESHEWQWELLVKKGIDIHVYGLE